MQLLKKKSPAAAVAAWFASSSTLVSLREELPWFPHVMVGVSIEIIARVPFGVKFRAWLGAAVSFAGEPPRPACLHSVRSLTLLRPPPDMLSDAYICRAYYLTGRRKLAESLMGMIGANLVYQLGESGRAPRVHHFAGGRFGVHAGVVLDERACYATVRLRGLPLGVCALVGTATLAPDGASPCPRVHAVAIRHCMVAPSPPPYPNPPSPPPQSSSTLRPQG